MLDKRNYELEYMRELQEKYKKDPALLERVLYAFGLLEALKARKRILHTIGYFVFRNSLRRND